MTYHPTTHPIRRLFGSHSLGAIDQQIASGARAGEYTTQLTPYNITPVQAQYVPSTIVTAMVAAGFLAGLVESGWSDTGHLWVTYQSPSGWSDTQRRTALTNAIRAAARNIASDAKLLLPGETAPSGATPTTAPPGTPTSVPSSGAASGRISGGTVGQSVSTSSVQSLLISKGYTLAGGADNTFGTSTANALKLALSAIGRYVVLGGQVTTYTPSSDKHSISFSSGTWEALQSAPNAGGTTALTSGAGPDWGAIAPFLVGGGVLVAVGAFFLLKKKPRAKMTVRNRRVRRNAQRFVYDVYNNGGVHLGSTAAVSPSDALRDFLGLTDEDLSNHWDTPWGEGQEWNYQEHGSGRRYIVVKRSGQRAIPSWDVSKNPIPHWDRPMAAAGLVSYRYRGSYGWIMIGATDDADALREAQRSTRDPVSQSRLQVWDGSKYVAIKKKRGTTRNPLPRGYSRKTMGKIIGIERRAGKSASQASAIAYSVARKAAHRAGARPSYLRSNATAIRMAEELLDIWKRGDRKYVVGELKDCTKQALVTAYMYDRMNSYDKGVFGRMLEARSG